MRFANHIKELEKRSRELADKLYMFISEPKQTLLITYHRQGYLPASIAYWFIATMEPTLYTILHESNTLAYYVVPYREGGKILFYSTNPYSASTLNILQVANLTGKEILLFTMKPRDERIEAIYSRYRRLYVDIEDELKASLVMAIASYYAFAKYYRKELGRRGARLYKHSVEGLAPIIEELVNKYVEQLEKIVKNKEVIVTSSKLLEPVALYFAEALKRIGVDASYQHYEYLSKDIPVIFLTTSVEEYFTREILFKFNLMRIKSENIVLNTDPLEAQIYFALLAYYIMFSGEYDTR